MGQTVDFSIDPQLDRFREMVRAAIAEMLPPRLAENQKAHGGINSAHADALEWTAILNQRGWSVPHWPVEYGGTGWSPMELHVFNDELAKAWAPDTCWGATHMCGPVIYTFGSEEQKARFLPDFRAGRYYLAQGFSEPGNGSDLARLRTSARREGDRYIVNGQKIWTGGAFAAQWGFFLVRTDPEARPQAGISFLMIRMDSRGVTIRRIPQINGDADLCEVFLDNVEVPAENLIGEENQGWTYAKFLLDHERTTSSFIFFNKRELARARAMAQAETRDGRPLADCPLFRARFARIEAELVALEWSVLRELANEDIRYDRTAAASTLKIAGSRLQQAISELQVDILGQKALRFFPFEPQERADPGPLWPDHVAGRTANALIARAATIYGGTL
ncbi:MAG: acyl-CoA dehydrogenase family protein, partial [Novosphingobium sp.]|nr:acyl-CoA dehydrogenase family protein [Novosphingobium sp.]